MTKTVEMMKMFCQDKPSKCTRSKLLTPRIRKTNPEKINERQNKDWILMYIVYDALAGSINIFYEMISCF